MMDILGGFFMSISFVQYALYCLKANDGSDRHHLIASALFAIVAVICFK